MLRGQTPVDGIKLATLLAKGLCRVKDRQLELSLTSVVGIVVGLPMSKAVSAGVGSNGRKHTDQHLFCWKTEPSRVCCNHFSESPMDPLAVPQSACQLFPAGSFHWMTEVRRRAVPKQLYRVSSIG